MMACYSASPHPYCVFSIKKQLRFELVIRSKSEICINLNSLHTEFNLTTNLELWLRTTQNENSLCGKISNDEKYLCTTSE